MKNIRRKTFETNSSSCHSLTVVDKDLKKKLYAGDVFYRGNIEYDCNEGLYRNEIDGDLVITKQALIENLNAFIKDKNAKKSENNKYKNTEITEDNLMEAMTNFWMRNDFYRYSGITITYPKFFLGEEDNSDLIDRFDLTDNKELRIVEICC